MRSAGSLSLSDKKITVKTEDCSIRHESFSRFLVEHVFELKKRRILFLINNINLIVLRKIIVLVNVSGKKKC